ncbi:sugar-binding transcriptional regulator [Stappia sp. BW2]|uniref:sugar-binding transcriptional regulator n=1 Tax=Stappia sp. BW2 TaxID=2592622 RepID=UPI0011DED862|nr:sugar-binding transcriptional regulator [Stappia sp. BW2]TYC80510.1 sugar-binding transcriptional regulator [Stappia sp. BW2]
MNDGQGLTPTKSDGDADLAARAAWLHYVGGMTQAEVAKRLNVPNTRAHRYIARAQNEGLVRIFVDVEATDCVQLETELMNRYSLDLCRIGMDIPDNNPIPLKTLSAVGANFFMQAAAGRKHQVIGVGNGRTLAASVNAMGRQTTPDVRFVSVLGGLTRSFAANPYDVIHRLAQKTNAASFLMPAPLYANSAGDKQVMLKQFGIVETMELIEEATLVVVGIGDVGSDEGGISCSMLDGASAAMDLRKAGAVAEMLGQFLSEDGGILTSPYDDRVMAPPLETLRGREVVAIAGGKTKIPAIRAALASGLLTGLITDEATARAIVERPPA